jgi:DNA-binding CsgD family transcriptional regulator
MTPDSVRDERLPGPPPVVVVARDANRRQALVTLAERAGLDVLGAYPAWPAGSPIDAVLIVDGPAAADIEDAPAVVVGARRAAGPHPAARAHLPAPPPPEQLAAAVLAVHAGLSAHPAGQSETDATAGEDLTPREHDVLIELARGSSNRDIAAALGISENTVKFHVATILAKLQARSRAEAVMAAVRRGVLPL